MPAESSYTSLSQINPPVPLPGGTNLYMVHFQRMFLAGQLLFETPEAIFSRTLNAVCPGASKPALELRFRHRSGLSASARLRQGTVFVSLSDLLQPAPAHVMEALAWLLLCRLYRLSAPEGASRRWQEWAQSAEVSSQAHQRRKSKRRKRLVHPEGEHYHLQEIFRQLNDEYFAGNLKEAFIGWSLRPGYRVLGHHDQAYNAISISSVLDSPKIPRLFVEFVVYHEMLHIVHPPRMENGRRQIHPKEFRQAEKQFRHYKEAMAILKAGIWLQGCV
jgi:hypothetical protein